MQRLEIRCLCDQMNKVVTHVSTRPDFTIDPELQRLIQPVTNTAQGVVDLAHPHAPPFALSFLRGRIRSKTKRFVLSCYLLPRYSQVIVAVVDAF
jgi:hypothetical protein